MIVGIFVPGYIVTHEPYSFLPDLAIKEGINLFVHERKYSALLDRRADDLKDEIVRLSNVFGDKLILVGHSRGGTDITYTLHKFPFLRKHVKGVITMASPHKGSLLADLALDPKCDLKMKALNILVDHLNEEETVRELTSERMHELQVRPIEGVEYLSYVFWANKKKIVGPSNIDYFWDSQIESDSTVSMDSQRFGVVAAVMEADHKSQSLPFHYGYPILRWFNKPYKKIWSRVFDTMTSI